MASFYPRIQKWNQKEDPFHQLVDKAQAWIAFIKFYFYDPKSANLRVSEGTGFLNSKYTVITACHNLYLLPEKIKCTHCVIHLRDPSKNNKQIKIRSRPHSEWFQNGELDLALIGLQDEVKYFKGGVYFGDAVHFQNQKLTQLYVVGFSTKIKKQLSNEKTRLHKIKSTFDEFTQKQILYTAETQKGLSGSPIIYRYRDNNNQDNDVKLLIMGMHLSRNQQSDNCKGVLFNDNTLNLIWQWMSQLQLQKKYIESRFYLLTTCFTKILERVKQQLLKEGRSGMNADQSQCFTSRKKGQYMLEKYDRVADQGLKDLQRQLKIDQKCSSLMDSILNEESKEEIYQSIADIFTRQSQKQTASILMNSSIQKIKQKGKQHSNLIQLNIVKNIGYGLKNNIEEQQLPQRESIIVIREQRLSDRPKNSKIIEDKQSPRPNGQRISQISDQSTINLLYLMQPSFDSPNISMSEQSVLLVCKNDCEESRNNIISDNQLSVDTPSLCSNLSKPQIINENVERFRLFPCKQTPQPSILSHQLDISMKKDRSLGKDQYESRCRQNEVAYSDLSNFPYNCIGHIPFGHQQKGEIAIGTGFLISPQLVLTSANIFLGKGKDELVPQSFTIFGGLNEPATWKKVRILNYRRNRQFMDCQEMIDDNDRKMKQCPNDDQLKRYQIRMKDHQIQHDFALLQLEEPVLKSHYFELFGDTNPFFELDVSGFIKRKDKLCQINNKTRIQTSSKTSDRVLYYSLDTQDWQSGCPIYIKNKDSVKLVGINSSYSAQSKINMGVYISYQIISIIQQWAKEMQSNLAIHDPKIVIKNFQEELQSIKCEYEAVNRELKLIKEENRRLEEVMQCIRSQYLTLSSQKQALKLQFEKNNVQKCKLQKDKQFQNIIIQQTQKKLQQLQVMAALKATTTTTASGIANYKSSLDGEQIDYS